MRVGVMRHMLQRFAYMLVGKPLEQAPLQMRWQWQAANTTRNDTAGNAALADQQRALRCQRRETFGGAKIGDEAAQVAVVDPDQTRL